MHTFPNLVIVWRIKCVASMETKTEFVKFVWTLRVWVESVETSMLERTRLFIKFIYVLNVTEKIHYLPVSGSICCRYVLVWYLCIICVLMFEHMYRSCVCVCVGWSSVSYYGSWLFLTFTLPKLHERKTIESYCSWKGTEVHVWRSF